MGKTGNHGTSLSLPCHLLQPRWLGEAFRRSASVDGAPEGSSEAGLPIYACTKFYWHAYPTQKHTSLHAPFKTYCSNSCNKCPFSFTVNKRTGFVMLLVNCRSVASGKAEYAFHTFNHTASTPLGAELNESITSFNSQDPATIKH